MVELNKYGSYSEQSNEHIMCLENEFKKLKYEKEEIERNYNELSRNFELAKVDWKNAESDYVLNIERLKKENKSLESNIQSVFIERDEIQAQLHKKSKVEFDQCTKVNDRVARLTDEIKILNEEKNKYRNQVAEVNQLKSKHSNMKILYKQKELEIDNLKDDLRKKDSSIQELNRKIDKLTFELMQAKAGKRDEYHKTDYKSYLPE